jgi:hypothetical protein
MDRGCGPVRFDLSAFRELTLTELLEHPLIQLLMPNDGFAATPVRPSLAVLTKPPRGGER